jgi:glycosyltransferase involved in cell wall biosynthesis
MPLKVLQIASSFPRWGGTEIHILNLSEQLRLRGHSVTIACQPGRWVEGRARELGIPTTPVTVDRLHDRKDMPALRRFLRDNKVDVLHAHWSQDMIIPPVSAMLEHVPVRILSRHLPNSLKNRAGGWIYSNILFSRVVTVSESVRQTLLTSGMSPGRVDTIHHGTDIVVFGATTQSVSESRQALGVPEGAIAVGIVGRVASEKGHKYLFEAIRLLGDRYPLCCVVIGEGPDDEKLQALVQELGIQDKVIFGGFRSDVNNAINGLDIVAVPSTWAEPCSAAIQQGMVLGKPIIGTLSGGTPEMIVEGKTGLLVPVEDANALAEAIGTLAGDANLRMQMGVAGRERVEALFSLSVMTDKIEALYQSEYAKARGARALQKVTAA